MGPSNYLTPTVVTVITRLQSQVIKLLCYWSYSPRTNFQADRICGHSLDEYGDLKTPKTGDLGSQPRLPPPPLGPQVITYTQFDQCF